MPLSKRARIEVYLPQRGVSAYARLEKAFEREFITTFGGCTIIKDTKGFYLDANGDRDSDRINVIYADTPFVFDENFDAIAEYADHLRDAALQATNEEAVLVTVHAIYHSVSDVQSELK